MNRPVTELICKRDTELSALIEFRGPVVEAYIRQTAADQRAYTLSFKLEKLSKTIYLATFRLPDQPRIFKTVDAAISTGVTLIPGKKAKKFTVVAAAE